MSRIVSLVAILVAAALLSPLSTANATNTEPVGDLHAFSVQPDNSTCTPGYIHINGVRGVDYWMVDGIRSEPGNVTFRGGVQADVYAVPEPGFHIDDVQGSPDRPFYLQVMPLDSDCSTPARTRRDWKPCHHEDSTTRCIWDARHRGNGEGRSFKITRHGCHKWVSHRKAHRLLAR